MDFVVEVPGEAVPLSYGDLCKALQAGTAVDQNQRQSASAQLKEWEAHPDFFLSLQVRELCAGARARPCAWPLADFKP